MVREVVVVVEREKNDKSSLGGQLETLLLSWYLYYIQIEGHLDVSQGGLQVALQ